MKVIGVIGKNGSGKDEVLKYLKDKHNVPFLSTGDIVREIASREGRTPNRTNLQEISDSYFQQYGKGCFVKMLAQDSGEGLARGWNKRRPVAARRTRTQRDLQPVICLDRGACQQSAGSV
jgi:hypothetical protein